MEKKKIARDHPKFKELQNYRMKLIEQIGNYDEEIGDMYLNEKEISGIKLKSALRQILINQQDHNLCPIFLGTSFKNKGVQPVMDAIVDLLPSPN